MAGWTVLSFWADRKPLERRGVSPITIAPVVAGPMAKDEHAVHAGRLSSMSLAPVRALQLGLVGLFWLQLSWRRRTRSARLAGEWLRLCSPRTAARAGPSAVPPEAAIRRDRGGPR
jgi:hypothetical protein